MNPIGKARAALAATRKAHRLPDDIDVVLDNLRARLADVEREITRISPQVAALEERLESVRERVESPEFTGTDAERSEARSLIDDVRREHAQVRARISAATVFEERLRVLESKAGVHSATGRDL